MTGVYQEAHAPRAPVVAVFMKSLPPTTNNSASNMRGPATTDPNRTCSLDGCIPHVAIVHDRLTTIGRVHRTPEQDDAHEPEDQIGRVGAEKRRPAIGAAVEPDHHYHGYHQPDGASLGGGIRTSGLIQKDQRGRRPLTGQKNDDSPQVRRLGGRLLLLGAQHDGWIDPHRAPGRDRGGKEGNDQQSHADHRHRSDSG
jgi:hypothetical protein